MADGVFLWVRLVVYSLLNGVGHHDSPSALRQKLKALPKDLDELFDKLLGSIDPANRKRFDKIFLIATRSGFPLNSLIFSWLDDLEDPVSHLRAPSEVILTRKSK